MLDKYSEEQWIASQQSSTEMNRLAYLIYNHSPQDGTFSQRISGLHTVRYSKISKDWVKSFYFPSVIIVAQGVKAVRIGKETFQISRGCMLMIPVGVPVALKTIKASSKEPFLAIGLTLELEKIAEFVSKVYPKGIPHVLARNAGYTTNADEGIISSVTRLLECLNNSSDTELISPIIKDEILMRLLRSSIGTQIAEIGFADSRVQHISKAIQWLLNNFASPMKVSDLAMISNMSVSVFHKHFKEATSMSPLQYQKVLRLQEARHLMLSKKMDAATACQLVGYASASQFSRDYSNYFGNPPRKDIAILYQQLKKTDQAHDIK
ncbi:MULTISPECIES: AraC family transcriptional regulator [unclassified Clostridium]|uniref:AraC family transcriptional regulator n=1 Tax=unclassified Clostridium TaxID=2614128 RepID=UPI00029772CF|nr:MULTISPECIES: AraC family transcriptional regulator [unclassified Clostridium]EKQ54741.1 MAG: DNA-binding domain-containing protein, AraC-type [Clostridium sp. Maddingley MBC34-26]